MNIHEFWDYLIPGIALGALYAVIAIGYTLVYGVLQLINFAHSEVFMMGGFASLVVLTAIVPSSPSGLMSVGLIAIGLLTAGLAGAGTAFALEKAAYRPLRKRNAPRLAFLISAIGASFFLQNLAGKLFGRDAKALPEQIYKNKTVFTVFGTDVKVLHLLMLGCAVGMMVILDLVVNRTKMGAGIRAVAQDAETASLMGVDIDKVISRTFLLGGMMGGAAGFLFGLNSQLSFTMGFLPGITAFAAAVVGGVGNIRGAMIGGMLLGLVETFSSPIFGEEWRYVSAFVVLVLVLMFRPTGILGERLGRSA
jgi:branched-chain amino acid transport system permease protein